MSTSPARRVAPGLLAASGLLAATTLAARAVGFGRWLVFSGSVGSTCVGSVYNSTNVLPNVLFEVAAGGALAAVAVPLVAGALGRGDRETADRTASAMLTWALVVLVPLGLLMALLAGPIAHALVDSSTCAGASALGAQMLTVFAPQVPLYGVGIVLAGVLQAHRRFLAAALAPLLSSLVVICAYVGYGALAHGRGDDPSLRPSGAAYLLSGGTTLGVVVLSLPLLLPVVRAGVRLRATLRFPAGTVGRARGLAAAGVLALVAQQAAVLVTVHVANFRSVPGTITVYQYVQAVYLLPYAVLAVPLAVSAFPALAAATGEWGTPAAATSTTATTATTATKAATVRSGSSCDEHPSAQRVPPGTGGVAASAILATTARGVALASALGAGLLVAVAVPVGAFFASLDAGRGNAAGGAALAAMPGALVAFAPGLLGFGLSALLTRAVYALGRPAHAAACVAGGWLVAAAGPLALLRGQEGPERTLEVLGWSSSTGMTLAGLLLCLTVRREWGGAALRRLGWSTAAGVLGALAAAGAGRLLAAALPSSSLASALGVSACCAVLAGGLFAGVVAVADPGPGRALLARLSRSRGESRSREVRR